MIIHAIGAQLSSVQFDGLALAAQGNARALAMLAEKAVMADQMEKAVQLAQQALHLAPDDPEINSIAQPIIADSVPRWHFNIVKDEQRNAAFEAAIKRAVTSESRVLDIGSGTGLLAMMAARSGAHQITSCEMNPVVAKAASEIISANGFSERIRVVSKHSMSLDPLSDMGGQADIIVSEIISNDFVCEGVLPALNDAACRLLKPGGQMIPRKGSVVIALAHWGRLAEFSMGEVCDFDLTSFNRLRPTKFKVQVDDPKLSIHSNASQLFTFDFRAVDRAASTSRVELQADGNPINGIAQWICLEMDDEGKLETRPSKYAKSSWACQFLALRKEITPTQGTVVSICGAQTTNNLRMWIDAGA